MSGVRSGGPVPPRPASYRTKRQHTNSILPNAAKNTFATGGQDGSTWLVCRSCSSGVEGSMDTKIVTYLKRMGFAAFMFFFLKGLAWLAVFYFGWQVIG